MKMYCKKRLFFLILIYPWLFALNADAQGHFNTKLKADSLLKVFENDIYGGIYEPNPSAHFTAQMTFLKIEINAKGKITDINFSDNADPSLVKSFKNRPRYNDDYINLELYAQSKSYKAISLLIPVIYWVRYETIGTTTEKQNASIMQFDKKNFIGKAIVLPSLDIGMRAN